MSKSNFDPATQKFNSPMLAPDDEEEVVIFSCHRCRSKTIYTKQEWDQRLFKITNSKCTCGGELECEYIYWPKEKVDRELRNVK